MPRGGPPYNIHELKDIAGNAIASGVGELLLQTKIPVDTTSSSVTLEDRTAFGTGLHMSVHTSSLGGGGIVTVWRVPENFTLSQLTGVAFDVACKRFQDMLWSIHLPKPRAYNSGSELTSEIADQITSKRTFGPKDTLVVIMYNVSTAEVTFKYWGFLDYFYA